MVTKLVEVKILKRKYAHTVDLHVECKGKKTIVKRISSLQEFLNANRKAIHFDHEIIMTVFDDLSFESDCEGVINEKTLYQSLRRRLLTIGRALAKGTAQKTRKKTSEKKASTKNGRKSKKMASGTEIYPDGNTGSNVIENNQQVADSDEEDQGCPIFLESIYCMTSKNLQKIGRELSQNLNAFYGEYLKLLEIEKKLKAYNLSPEDIEGLEDIEVETECVFDGIKHLHMLQLN